MRITRSLCNAHPVQLVLCWWETLQHTVSSWCAWSGDCYAHYHLLLGPPIPVCTLLCMDVAAAWLARSFCRCSPDSSHAAADSSFSNRRELCFTLEGEIFVRYQSYKVGGGLLIS